MSDIFEEVEESVRKDRAARLWRRFAPFVWAGALALVAGVGLMEYLGYQAEQARADRARDLETAIAALEAGQYAEAGAGFEALIADGTPLSPMAAHYLARVRLEGGGDPAGAADVLMQVADAEGSPFERLALLKAAYLRADGMDLAALREMLGDLPEAEAPIGLLAEELLAAKALAEGDVETARSEYNYLRIAPNAPQGLSQRAMNALAILPGAAGSPAEAQAEAQAETPAETPAETSTDASGETPDDAAAPNKDPAE